jgi:DNA polymerase III alpha subunit
MKQTYLDLQDAPKPPKGYTAEELERDNPYNAWMREETREYHADGAWSLAIPQLRVRTEFSFRNAFGPVAKVVSALTALGCPAAGIVDGGTWGHARWAKALAKTTTKPLFGTELVVAQPDGKKPTAWALAGDSKQFYRFSTAARRPEADIEALFADSPGIIRFSGAALTDPETFDYIDLNPASPLQQRRALNLHARTGRPMVITSDNYYPSAADYGAFMAIVGKERATPQHILPLADLRHSLRLLDDRAFAGAIESTFEAASRCCTALPTAPLIHFDGDLRALAEAGKRSRIERGHIVWSEVHEERLRHELEMIELKKFESYFLVVADLISWSKERMLVGPGRGSSAGSLLCYLIGITEVDPLPHGLLFERFIDVTRADLPDIDIDFSDTRREMCFTYLAEKYGAENVARLGNINTLKPRSVMAEVCKRFGIPDKDRFDVINVLIEYSSGDSRYGKCLEDTMAQTDSGRKFAAAHPEAMVLVDTENHAWHTGVHAAGVIVSNEPVSDYCTVGADGVAQIDKQDSEQLNLLKIDALGLRTLGIIEDACVTTAEELYALKLDDPEVFKIFNDNKFTGVFQFEGQSQRTVSCEIEVNDFRTIDHITALARPGPLGGGATNKYIKRKRGDEEVTTAHPKLTEMLADTYGVVLYQEQVMSIVREIGKFTWAETTIIRKAMSGRKGKEYFDAQGEKFIKGAAQDGIAPDAAQDIWNEICSFGAWGMNRAHTCAYAVISYWCAWMKRYHPLAYAASCLRHAKDDEQTLELLREMDREGVSYVPFDIERSGINWAAVDGNLMGGFTNLVGVGPAKASAAITARNAGKLTDAMRAKFAALPIKFQELYPLTTGYADLYANPEKYGCREGSVFTRGDEMPMNGSVLHLARIDKKQMSDHNDAVRVKKREGRRMKGQTLFADFFLRDDSGVPITARIDRFDYEPLGRLALDRLQPGDVVMVRGDKIPGFPMIKVVRIKCMNREVDLTSEAPPEES